MKVLLINPVSRASDYPVFPLGLGYIAAILVGRGDEVEVLDLNAYRREGKVVEEKIKQVQFDWVGIGSILTQYPYLKWLCEKLKNYHPHKPVVIGGGLASIVPELLLQSLPADLVVIGEGEKTVTELAANISRPDSFSRIPGLCFRRGGEIINNGRPEPVEINTLPFPKWDLFPMEIYLRNHILGFGPGIRSMPMISSRGCPYQCSYCDHSIFGYKYRARGAKNLIAEILALKGKHDIQAVNFCDDLLVFDRSRVDEFCAILIKEKIKIKWSCNGRVNLMDKDLLQTMKKAGCVTIGYGIESGSPKILKEMNKNITVEEAGRAIKLTWQAGITPFSYLMFGMPGEDEESIRQTSEFCQKSGIAEGFGFVSPIPKTRLYELAQQKGKVTDCLELVEKWGEWQNTPLVNLTNFNDRELVTKKEAMEKEIFRFILKRKKRLLLKKVYFYLRVNGWRETFLILFRRWFKYRKIQNPVLERPYSKILVINLQGMGNLLLATQSLSLLKRCYPTAHLSLLLAGEKQKQIIKGDKNIDQVIVWPGLNFSGVKRLFKLAGGRYELVFVPYWSGRKSAILARFTGARVRVGYRSALYSHPFSVEGGFSDSEINIRMLELLGLTFFPEEIKSSSPKIIVSPDEKDWTNRWLLRRGINEANFLIGLHPGCGQFQKWKRWPKEKFVSLIGELRKNFSAYCILFGGDEERELLHEIYRQMSDRADMFLSDNIQQTAALIERCHLFISNDSFLKLLAVAMDVPTIGIFGPTDPLRTKPQGEIPYFEVKKDLPCRPCFKFQKNFFCRTMDCFRLIEVGDVLKAVVAAREGIYCYAGRS